MLSPSDLVEDLHAPRSIVLYTDIGERYKHSSKYEDARALRLLLTLSP